MNFTILVNAAPFAQQSAHTAYQFCKTALEKKHFIVRVFFYQDGVHNANRLIASPPDEINLMSLWQELAEQYQIDLTLCVTSATRRGITVENLAKKFKIAGLGQLIEAIINSDRFISFG